MLLSLYILQKNSFVYLLLMSTCTVQIERFQVYVDLKDMCIHVCNHLL